MLTHFGVYRLKYKAGPIPKETRDWWQRSIVANTTISQTESTLSSFLETPHSERGSKTNLMQKTPATVVSDEMLKESWDELVVFMTAMANAGYLPRILHSFYGNPQSSSTDSKR